MVDTANEDDLVIQSSDMALMNISSLAASGALDLSPRFQRRNRWDRVRQSQLIESFLMNVPVPPVYLAEEARGVFAVIDGKQRLTAITQFFNDEFPLKNLQLRRDLEGRLYSDLALEVSSGLNLRPLRTVTVMRKTPDWVKHEVFIRLNRGGQPLNAQEIRNVAYASPLNDAIIRLGENEFLRRQLKIVSDDSSSYTDMTNVEFVVRFFALSDQWEKFGGSMRASMDRFMADHYESGPSQIAVFEKRFERAILYAEKFWGSRAFHRFDGGQWRDQLIGGLFDAQMIAIDQLADSVLDRSIADPTALEAATRSLFSDPEFDAAVRLGTNTSSRVTYRVKAVMSALMSI